MNSRPIKIIGIFVAALIAGCILFSVALSHRDSRTRTDLLRVVASELRAGATKEEMTRFLRKRTSRFALDENYRHEYGGFIPQTALDKLLFDRQVQILFKLHPDGRMKEAQVWIFYTSI